MLKQKIFKGTNSSVVSATIDADGDLYYHNIPSKYLIPSDGMYEVKDKTISDIWEYEYISGNHSTVNWKESKADHITKYGLNFFKNIISFNVLNKLNHFDLDGTKSTTALGDIVLDNTDEHYELNITIDILLSDAKLDEHSLDFNLIESTITKKHSYTANFDSTNLAENVTKELASSNEVIAKYIRARIFDRL